MGTDLGVVVPHGHALAHLGAPHAEGPLLAVVVARLHPVEQHPISEGQEQRQGLYMLRPRS